MKHWILIAIFVLGYLVLGMIAGEEDQALELQLYCEMVLIRKTTQDPMSGWPDYRKIYDAECVTPSSVPLR